jgi:hypothetical protein
MAFATITRDDSRRRLFGAFLATRGSLSSHRSGPRPARSIRPAGRCSATISTASPRRTTSIREQDATERLLPEAATQHGVAVERAVTLTALAGALAQEPALERPYPRPVHRYSLPARSGRPVAASQARMAARLRCARLAPLRDAGAPEQVASTLNEVADHRMTQAAESAPACSAHPVWP